MAHRAAHWWMSALAAAAAACGSSSASRCPSKDDARAILRAAESPLADPERAELLAALRAEPAVVAMKHNGRASVLLTSTWGDVSDHAHAHGVVGRDVIRARFIATAGEHGIAADVAGPLYDRHARLIDDDVVKMLQSASGDSGRKAVDRAIACAQ